MTRTADVLAAAADLVSAFGNHDTELYFDCVAPDATFLFHDHLGLIDGFHVDGCRSLEPAVTLVGDDTAVFTHRVRTVFHHDNGRWLAVHEHLSVDPEGSEHP